MLIKSLMLLLSLILSFSSFGITVDKMVIIPSKDEKRSEIKVNNPDLYPVFLKLSLSELDDNGQIVESKVDDFQNWAVYLDRDEYVLDPSEEIIIPVQLLARQLGKMQNKDRIIAIDIMPESVVNSDPKGQVMNILIGYRVWLILSKDGEILGKPSVELGAEGYVLKNDSNSVAIYNLDLCETSFKKGVECRGSEFVLSGKEKKLDLKAFKGGQGNISIKDPYSRYLIESKINL